MTKLRSFGALSVVLGSLCAACMPALAADHPKDLWYRFVVAATLVRTVVSTTVPPAGEPSRSSTRILRVSWVAGSTSATIMSLQPDGDVSLTAGMLGRADRALHGTPLRQRGRGDQIASRQAAAR